MRTSNTDTAETDEENGERIDKWLWAARFYKTRSLAAAAIDGGKVEVNGERVKRSRLVHAGDTIAVREGPFLTTVLVRALSQKRGPASAAILLYSETEASRAARERTRTQLASLPSRPAGKGRPSKRERRQIRKLRDDEG